MFCTLFALLKVRLTIIAFSTEANKDYLTIYDGSSSSSTVLGSFSGKLTKPHTVKTTQMTAYVKFTTNNAVESSGFTATYTEGQF